MMQCRLARTRSKKQRARFSGVSTKSGLVLIAKGRTSAAIMCSSSCFGTQHVKVAGEGTASTGAACTAAPDHEQLIYKNINGAEIPQETRSASNEGCI